MRRTIAAGAALMTMAAASGCSSGLLGDDEDKDGPVKIGLVVPLSGSSAPIGPSMRNGAQLAVDEINDAGGVLGRKVELDVEDEACDPATSVAAANKVVSNGAVAVVGGYCSSSTLPMLPVFAKAGIPVVDPAANSEELVEQGLDNFFLINPTGSQQADAARTWIGERGAHQVAIVDDNTSYSVDIAERTRDLVEADGVSTSSTSVTAGESDYSSAVSDVLSEDPDLVYWTGYFQEGGLLVNQLRRAGYDGDVMIADGSVDPSFVKIAGDDNAEGVFATMTQTPDTIEGAEDWIASYRDEFDSEPGPYSTQSYDAVRVAVAAIKDAGSTDGDDVIAALEDLDGFEIFSGPLHFTEEHTLSEGGFQVLVVKHGKFVLEDPLR